MYHMLQKCTIWSVFTIFCEDPLKVHYIKEIARKIKLAHTSVKKHLESLFSQDLVYRIKGERFIGFIANRDSEIFLFYKRISNLIKLKESGILDYIIHSCYPKAIILYGSYSRGEDIKESDIDILVLTKFRKPLSLEKFEAILKREVHLINVERVKNLNMELRNEIINGIKLYGYLTI